MKRLLMCLAVLCAAAGADDRVALQLDTSEAEAVLAILDKGAARQPVDDADWQRLFGSAPYQRLKKREAGLKRDFTDDDFRRFVLSPELAARAGELRRTLAAWKRADLGAAAARILPYLPRDARVRAHVYPVIKPQSNSFVFEVRTDPAIFLYLDPEMSEAAFESTVAHEAHHIGYASGSAAYDKVVEAAPAARRPVLNWIGAFGEGLAVLAAAGGPEAHPIAAYTPLERARWDEDMKSLGAQFAQLDTFFQDVLRGGFQDDEAINHVGYLFFGYRGPWYTVGWKMGAVVEQRYGRAVLIECAADPRQLLLRYNEAAAERNQKATAEKLPLWSPQVIEAVSGK